MDSRVINDIQYAWLRKHNHPGIIHSGWRIAKTEDAVEVCLFVRGETGGLRSTRRRTAMLDLCKPANTVAVINDAMDEMYAQLVEGIETYG